MFYFECVCVVQSCLHFCGHVCVGVCMCLCVCSHVCTSVDKSMLVCVSVLMYGSSKFTLCICLSHFPLHWLRQDLSLNTEFSQFCQV